MHGIGRSLTWRPWNRRAASGATERRGNLDWKTVSHNVLLAGLFVAMVTMFNQVNGRLDAMNGRIDALNERMDRMQAENNGRFDEMQAEMNRRFDRIDQRSTRYSRCRASSRDAPRSSKRKPGLAPKTPSNELLAPAYGRGSAASPTSGRSKFPTWRPKGGVVRGFLPTDCGQNPSKSRHPVGHSVGLRCQIPHRQ